MNERIPKIKKTQIKNNLQSVDINNRDVQNLLREINKTCLDTEFLNQWEALEISMVHNAELEGSYISKRSELKDEGRTAASLSDQLGFLVVNPVCKTSIINNGLKATRQYHNRLGKGECGVYINKYFDIELKSCWKQGDLSKEIFVFKYFYGKRKAITLNNFCETEALLEPTPNYDCHTSSVHPKKEDNGYRQQALSSVYLYEYTDSCEPASFPRQCLPYAVIKCKKRQALPQSTMSCHQTLPKPTMTAPNRSLATPAIGGNTTSHASQQKPPASSNNVLSSPSPSCPKPVKLSSLSSDQNATMNQTKPSHSIQTSTPVSHGVKTDSRLLPGKDIARRIDKRSTGSMEEFLNQTPQYIDRLNEACAKLQNEHNVRNFDMMSSVLPSLLGSTGAPVENHLPQPLMPISVTCDQNCGNEVRDPRLCKSIVKVPDKKGNSSSDERSLSQVTLTQKPKKLTSETKKMSYSEYVKLKTAEKERKNDAEKDSNGNVHQIEYPQSFPSNENDSAVQLQSAARGSSVEDSDSLPQGVLKSMNSHYMSKFQPPPARPEGRSNFYSQFQSPQAQPPSKSDLFSQFQSPIPSQLSTSQNLFQSFASSPMAQKDVSMTSNSFPSFSPKSRPSVEKKAFLPFPVLCEDGSIKNVFRGTRDGSLKEIPASPESKCKIKTTKKSDVETELPSQNVKEGADKLFKAFQNVFADSKNKKLFQRQVSNGRKANTVDPDISVTKKDLSIQQKTFNNIECGAMVSLPDKLDDRHTQETFIVNKNIDCPQEKKTTSPCITMKDKKPTTKYITGDVSFLKEKEKVLCEGSSRSRKLCEAKDSETDTKSKCIDKSKVVYKTLTKHSTEHRKDVMDRVRKDGKSQAINTTKLDCNASQLSKGVKSNDKQTSNKDTCDMKGGKRTADVSTKKLPEKRKESGKKHVKNKGDANNENKSKKAVEKENIMKDVSIKEGLARSKFKKTLEGTANMKGLVRDKSCDKVEGNVIDPSTVQSGRGKTLSGIPLNDGSCDSDILNEKHTPATAIHRAENQSVEMGLDGQLSNDQLIESELELLYEHGSQNSFLSKPSETCPKFICRSPNADIIPGIGFSLDLSVKSASTKSCCSPLRLIPSLCSDDANNLDASDIDIATKQSSVLSMEENEDLPTGMDTLLPVSKPEPTQKPKFQQSRSKLSASMDGLQQSVSTTVENCFPLNKTPLNLQLVNTLAKQLSTISSSLQTPHLSKCEGKIERNGDQNTIEDNVGHFPVSSVESAGSSSSENMEVRKSVDISKSVAPLTELSSNLASQHEFEKEKIYDKENKDKLPTFSITEGNFIKQKSPTLSSSSSSCLLIDESCESSTSVSDKGARLVEQCKTDVETGTPSSSDCHWSDNEGAAPLPRLLSLKELGFGFYLQALSDSNYQPSTVVVDFKEAIDKGYHHSECKTCRKELTSDIMAKYINDHNEEDSCSEDVTCVVQESGKMFNDNSNALRLVSSKVESKIDAFRMTQDLPTQGQCRGEDRKEGEGHGQSNCATVHYNCHSGSAKQLFSKKTETHGKLKKKELKVFVRVMGTCSPQKDTLDSYKSYKSRLMKRQRERSQLMKIKEKLFSKGIARPAKRKLLHDNNKIDSSNIEDIDELRDTLLDGFLSGPTDGTNTLQSTFESSNTSCPDKSKSQNEVDTKTDTVSRTIDAQVESNSDESDSRKHPLQLYDILEKSECEMVESNIFTKAEDKTLNVSMVPRSAQKLMKKKTMNISKKEIVPLPQDSGMSALICSSLSNDKDTLDGKFLSVSENCKQATVQKDDIVCIDQDETNTKEPSMESQAQLSKWKPVSEPGMLSSSDKPIHIKPINLSLSSKNKSETHPPKEPLRPHKYDPCETSGDEYKYEKEKNFDFSSAKETCHWGESDYEASSSNISQSQILKSPDLSLYLNQPLGDVDYRVGFHTDRQSLGGLPPPFPNLGGCGRRDTFVGSSMKLENWPSKIHDFGDVDYRTHVTSKSNYKSRPLSMDSISIGRQLHGSILSPEVSLHGYGSLQSDNHLKNSTSRDHNDYSLIQEDDKNQIGIDRKLLIWPSTEPNDIDHKAHTFPSVERNCNEQTVSKLMGSCEILDSSTNIMEKAISLGLHPTKSVTPISSSFSSNQYQASASQKDINCLSEKEKNLSLMDVHHANKGSGERGSGNDFQDRSTSDNICVQKPSFIHIEHRSISLNKVPESGSSTKQSSDSVSNTVVPLVTNNPSDSWRKPEDYCAYSATLQSTPPFDNSRIREQNEVIGHVQVERGKDEISDNEAWMNPKALPTVTNTNKVTQNTKEASVSHLSRESCKDVKLGAAPPYVEECKEEDSNSIVENIRKCLPDILGTPEAVQPGMTYTYSDDESDEECNPVICKEGKLVESVETVIGTKGLNEGKLDTQTIDLTQDHVTMLKKAISTVSHYTPSCGLALPPKNDGSKNDIEPDKINLTENHVSMLKKAINTVTNVRSLSGLAKDNGPVKESYETGKVSLTQDQLSMLKSAVDTCTLSSIATSTRPLELDKDNLSENKTIDEPTQRDLKVKEETTQRTFNSLLRNLVDQFEDYDFSPKQPTKGNDKTNDVLCAFIGHISEPLAVDALKGGTILSHEKEIDIVKTSSPKPSSCHSKPIVDDIVQGAVEVVSDRVNEKANIPSDTDEGAEDNKVFLSDVPLEALTRAKLHVLEQLKSLNEDDDLDSVDSIVDEIDGLQPLSDEQVKDGYSETETPDFLSSRKKKAGDSCSGKVLNIPERGKQQSESLPKFSSKNMLCTDMAKTKFEVFDISSDSDSEELRVLKKPKRSTTKDDERLVVCGTSPCLQKSSLHSQSPFLREKNYDDYVEVLSSASDFSPVSSPIVSRRITSSNSKSSNISKSLYDSADTESPLLSHDKKINQNSMENKNTEKNENSKVRYQDLKISLDSNQNRKVKQERKRRVMITSSSKDSTSKTRLEDGKVSEEVMYSLSQFLKSARNEVVSDDKGKAIIKHMDQNSSPETKSKGIQRQNSLLLRESDLDKMKKDTSPDVWDRVSLKAREKTLPQAFMKDYCGKKSLVMELSKNRKEKRWQKDLYDDNQSVSSHGSWSEEMPIRQSSKKCSRDESRNRSPDLHIVDVQTRKGRPPVDYDHYARNCDANPDVRRERKGENDRYGYSFSEDEGEWGIDNTKQRLCNVSQDVPNRSKKHKKIYDTSPVSSSTSEASQIENLSSPCKKRRIVTSEDSYEDERKAFQPARSRTSYRGNHGNTRDYARNESDSSSFSGSGNYYSSREVSYSPKEYPYRGETTRNSKSSPQERLFHKTKMSRATPPSDRVSYFSSPGNSNSKEWSSSDHCRNRNEQSSSYANPSSSGRQHPLDELMRPLKKRKVPGGEELDYYLSRRDSYQYGHRRHFNNNARRY